MKAVNVVTEFLRGLGEATFFLFATLAARLPWPALCEATLTGRPAPSSGSLAGELAAFRVRHNLPRPAGR